MDADAVAFGVLQNEGRKNVDPLQDARRDVALRRNTRPILLLHGTVRAASVAIVEVTVIAPLLRAAIRSVPTLILAYATVGQQSGVAFGTVDEIIGSHFTLQTTEAQSAVDDASVALEFVKVDAAEAVGQIEARQTRFAAESARFILEEGRCVEEGAVGEALSATRKVR